VNGGAKLTDVTNCVHNLHLIRTVKRQGGTELYMDWIHPWIGLDWIGLDWVEIFKNVRGLDWFGSETQNIIFEQVNKFNCITVLLLNRNRETDKSCSLHTYIVT